MDNIENLLSVAEQKTDSGHQLQRDGKVKEAYVAVEQAIHLYHAGSIIRKVYTGTILQP